MSGWPPLCRLPRAPTFVRRRVSSIFCRSASAVLPESKLFSIIELGLVNFGLWSELRLLWQTESPLIRFSTFCDRAIWSQGTSSGARGRVPRRSRASESSQKLADELVKREILTAWQAEMLLPGKHRGFRLGPYRILRPLGQGGMSKVFLAEHEMMHRCCAIKILPSKYQEDPDLLNRFHLEAGPSRSSTIRTSSGRTTSTRTSATAKRFTIW